MGGAPGRTLFFVCPTHSSVVTRLLSPQILDFIKALALCSGEAQVDERPIHPHVHPFFILSARLWLSVSFCPCRPTFHPSPSCSVPWKLTPVHSLNQVLLPSGFLMGLTHDSVLMEDTRQQDKRHLGQILLWLFLC